ncbi:hypothetical protein K450DRAFT_227404 [Umbelopsis ramanniana AG]|uniref:Uncharacterized protein n=1 Tax=Umbelopsis ramanniana AG TaxID=1314678 RepID=A0AAD5EGB1_UMBRA|nr:uncharacterized protein K450DRAFT_227404 [Umbelopsis ramanniana AG]KAI8582485.1 hypothetical protein K450DRAFT_227404 [Umbelopsis ramanniana AG]
MSSSLFKHCSEHPLQADAARSTFVSSTRLARLLFFFFTPLQQALSSTIRVFSPDFASHSRFVGLPRVLLYKMTRGGELVMLGRPSRISRCSKRHHQYEPPKYRFLQIVNRNE